MSTDGENSGLSLADTTTASGYVVVRCGSMRVEVLKAFFGRLEFGSGITYLLCSDVPNEQSDLILEHLSDVSVLPIVLVEGEVQLAKDTIYYCSRVSGASLANGVLTIASNQFVNDGFHSLNVLLMLLCNLRGNTGFVSLGENLDCSRLGLDRFKANGGIVIQEKSDLVDSEKHKSLYADRILRADEISRVLEDYFGLDTSLTDEQERAELDRIRMVSGEVEKRHGIGFSPYREKALRYRIVNRMILTKCERLEDYLRLLLENSEEAAILYREFLVGGDKFLKPVSAYQDFVNSVLPELIERSEDQDEVRIWVPGVGAGQEAYALAILFEEKAARMGIDSLNYRIFATDVFEPVLDEAKAGVYDETQIQLLSEERLISYFSRVDSRYVVKNAIRSRVVFAKHDVLNDPPFVRVDLLVCRNLLPYFKGTTQRRAMSLILYSVVRNGFLWLGPGEVPAGGEGQLESLDAEGCLFRKRGSVAIVPPYFRPPTSKRSLPPKGSGPAIRAKLTEDDVYTSSIIGVMEGVMPATIVIDRAENLVLTYGKVDPYLLPIKGRVLKHFTHRLCPELVETVELLRAEALASESDEREWRSTAVFGESDQLRTVEVRLRLIRNDKRLEDAVIVVFAEEERGQEGVASSQLAGSDEGNDIARLSAEISRLKGRLRQKTEELEAKKVELQFYNEELMTSNEELRSTNEELHSVNEQLLVINREYENRNVESADRNDVIDQMLADSGVEFVLLDISLKLRRFVLQENSFFNFISGDLGRPIGHLTHRFVEYEDLERDSLRVLRDQVTIEKQLVSRDKRSCLLRLSPYSKGRGVILSAFDISDLQRIAPGEGHFERTPDLEGIGFGLWRYEAESGLFDVSASFRRLMDLPELDTERLAKVFDKFGCGPAELEKRHDPQERFIRDVWQRVDRQGKEHFFCMRASVLFDQDGKLERVAGVIWDETEAKRNESQIARKSEELEMLLYVISHDLREPLRAIQSFSLLIDERYRENLDDKGRDFLNRIIGGCRRMGVLLDEVLQLSRVSREELDRDYVSAGRLVDSVLKALEARIEETGASVVVAADLPTIRVNFLYVAQALTNLVANALKFVDKGKSPQIEIAPYASPDLHLHGLVVRDRGIGVPDHAKERIFKLFQRAVPRSVEGTGAGLALVKQVAQKHGGDAWCEDRTGGGSAFYITFSS